AAVRAAVYLILRQEEQVLLARRYHTGFQDGNYSLVSGHVELGESLTSAMVREAYEEAGITLLSSQEEFVHLLHRKSDDDLIYFDFFFVAHEWTGTVVNCEPDRCDDLRWFPISALPVNMVGYVRDVLSTLADGTRLSESGWSA
nr:NUDIX domain-containing protein [Caldilineaceae bacterium]